MVVLLLDRVTRLLVHICHELLESYSVRFFKQLALTAVVEVDDELETCGVEELLELTFI